MPRSVPVKVLSVRQPYADLILFGGKWCENRTWPTRYRGRLYIHGSRWDGAPVPTPGAGRTGAILGSVELVECLSADDLELLWIHENMPGPRFQPKMTAAALARFPRLVPLVRGLSEEQMDRFVFGPVCWILTDPQPLAVPIPAAGRLNLWTFDLPVPPM